MNSLLQEKPLTGDQLNLFAKLKNVQASVAGRLRPLEEDEELSQGSDVRRVTMQQEETDVRQR